MDIVVRVWRLRFGAWGPGDLGLGFRIWDFGFGGWGFGALGFLGFRV